MDAAAIKSLLVDAIRMLEQLEIIDHSGHCSVRRDRDSFYINSGASRRNSLTTADIVAVDRTGALVEGTARPPLEFHLHAEVYHARPDVQVVMHTHPRWSTILTIAGVTYQPVYAQGVLLGEVPVLDSPLSINSKPMGERLTATLGAGRAVLLKSHGAAIVGSNIIECFALTTYLEENARRQYMALQIGRPYVFSAEEQESCRANLWSPALFAKSWDYYRSKL
jgi:ribulose-5-phosphate 4-epimerase/fuculose-1-phosphate aldolase